jgi:hypothetical protein
MLEIKTSPCPDCAVDSLFYEISVVRMSSLEYKLQRGLDPLLALKDPEGFFRPVDFSTRNVVDGWRDCSGVAICVRYAQKTLLV